MLYANPGVLHFAMELIFSIAPSSKNCSTWMVYLQWDFMAWTPQTINVYVSNNKWTTQNQCNNAFDLSLSLACKQADAAWTSGMFHQQQVKTQLCGYFSTLNLIRAMDDLACHQSVAHAVKWFSDVTSITKSLNLNSLKNWKLYCFYLYGAICLKKN